MHPVTLLPRLQQRDHGRDVGVDRVRQTVQPAERRHRLDAGIRPQNVFDLTDEAVGALERRAVGETDGDEEHALILVRQESSRRPSKQGAGGQIEHRKRQHAEHRAAHQRLDAEDVPIRRPRESAVEGAEDPCDQSACLSPRFQDERGEGRAECQRVERRQQHGRGNGQRELAIDLTGDAAEERDRYEHRGQDEGNRHDRP